MPDNVPKHPDCFIVLSYAVESEHMPTYPTRAIISLAYTWWKRFPTAHIILSTGDNQGLGVTNARVMGEYACYLGIPKKYIIEEDSSKNTYENLLYSWDIVKKKHYKAVTLVTYDLHTKRTLAIAKKIGINEWYWISTASPGSHAYGIKRFQTYSRLTIFFYEFLAYFYNWIRGQL